MLFIGWSIRPSRGFGLLFDECHMICRRDQYKDGMMRPWLKGILQEACGGTAM
jgi:hypothetical protein